MKSRSLQSTSQLQLKLGQTEKVIEINFNNYEAWREQGVLLSRLGRNEEAISSFDEAINLNPNDYEAWWNQGITLRKLGRNEEAISSFDQAIALNPNGYEAWWNRGFTLRKLGRNEEATSSLNQAITVLEVNPNDHEAWREQGVLLSRLGRNEEAISSFDEAINLNPNDYEAWWNRGLTLRKLGRNEEATSSLNQAITVLKFNTDDYEAWRERGVLLSRLGRNKEAISSFDQAIKLNPNDYETWREQGLLLSRLGRNEEAISSFDQAIKLNPNDYETWQYRGEKLSLVNRNEDAIANWDDAIKHNPDDYLFRYYRGKQYYFMKRYEDARISFEEASELKPNFHEVWRQLGLTLQKLGLEEDELTNWNKAIELNPNNYLLWCYEGDTLSRLGRYVDAFISFDKGIDINPEYPNAWSSQAHALKELGLWEEVIYSWDKFLELKPDNYEIWYQRGSILKKLGRNKEAEDNLNKVLELKPDYLKILERRPGNRLNKSAASDVNYNLENDDEDIDLYERVLEIDPDNQQAWHGKGVALNNLGRYEEAIDCFNEVIQLNPNFYEAYRDLGLARKNLGQWKEALSDLDQAVHLQPNDDDAWSYRGEVLFELKNLKLFRIIYSSCQNAISIKKDDYLSWYFLAAKYSFKKNYKKSIEYYGKTLEINPKFPDAWYEKGQDIISSSNKKGTSKENKIKKYQEAIDCFDEAIKFGDNYYLPYNGKGNALRSLGIERKEKNDLLQAIQNFEEALKLSYNSYWQSWRNMGFVYKYQTKYNGAVHSFEQGLKYIQPEDEDFKYGCGLLNYDKGKCLYKQGQEESNYVCRERAKKSYEEALKHWNFEEFQKDHLEVLEELVRVVQKLIIDYRGLGYAQKAEDSIDYGSELLNKLIEKTSEENQDEKIRLGQQFAGFNQFIIENLARSTDPKNKIKALEKAEERKNLCLSWIRSNRWAKTDSNSPKYSDIQSLLSPNTAAIYWHISPATITVFIIQSNQEYPDIIYLDDQLQEFKIWIKKWKEDYRDYRGFKNKLKKETKTPKTHQWRVEMEKTLDKLSEILGLTGIIEHLSDNINQLVLIPHRDLQLLPLHYCFLKNNKNRDYTITYLPSAKIGQQLQNNQSEINQQVLIVENFYTETIKKVIRRDRNTQRWRLKKETRRKNTLLFPLIESLIISQLYAPNSHRIPGDKATKTKVLEDLNNAGSFLFTGHGYHQLESPQESALSLAKGEKLTLMDILGLNLPNYYLVCLSACESGITSTDSLIDDYVGLVSGFLAAGVAHVVSTLWTVDDTASALLMMQFHELLKNQNRTPASALKEAQKWLRTRTPTDLAKHYRQLANQISGSSRLIEQCQKHLAEEAKKFEKNQATGRKTEYPYGDPYYWAGFTITGKLTL